MKGSKFSGYWLLVGSATLGIAVLAYFKGVSINPSPYSRVISVLLIGVLLLLLRAPLVGAWRWVARHSLDRKVGAHQRDSAARLTKTVVVDDDVSAQRMAYLKSALKQMHGWRWRYQRPWLLLVGDKSTVSRLFSDLNSTGWAITPDVVLLYAGEANQPDVAWLRRIRRTRRRRPVDAAIQMVRGSNADRRTYSGDALANQLSAQSRELGWAAPAYALSVVSVDGAKPESCDPIALTWANHGANHGTNHAETVGALNELSQKLADAGVQNLAQSREDRYLARISLHIAEHAVALSGLVAPIHRAHEWRAILSGIFFAPVFNSDPTVTSSADGAPAVLFNERTQATWQSIAAHSRHVYGRRVGFSWFYAVAWGITGLAALWMAGTVVSGVSNKHSVNSAGAVMATHSAMTNPTRAALDLDALQKQIDTLEIRQHEGAPWYSRFGLNHDAQALAALWPAYAEASRRTLIEPIRSRLAETLQQLSELTDEEIAGKGATEIKTAYGMLKTYLMMSEPKRADADFLIPRLLAMGAPERPERSRLSAGAWTDLTQRLVTFYAHHLNPSRLPADVSLAVNADGFLINSARQTLIGAVGLQNSTDAIYQQILDNNRNKYPPLLLQSLLGETSSRGLFTTQEMLDGLYTRAAWDERISKAINEADEQHAVVGDWVLSDTSSETRSKKSDVTSDAEAAAEPSLKAQLRERYFADYGRAWQQFLNSMRWQPDQSLPGTVDQLSLYADPQRSPLSALFKVIVYQAGTGAVGSSLSDNLINKAQQLVGGAVDPSKISMQAEAPLAPVFGPLLRLAGSDLAAHGTDKSATAQANNGSDMSLMRFLERVSAVRLKLQQIMMSPDPDLMSRMTAQTILQGKTSDLGDSRDYASRVAASLGQQWAGLGDALFQRPLDQTWDVVLQPAASSLNATWLSVIVSAWDQTFGGRYPFVDSDNDASLPEMARFLRSNNGLITQFVNTQLGGILERQGDQWIVEQSAGRNALIVDPEFVSGLNRLTRVANVMFPTGDASVRYELRAIPTPGITDLRFKLSGRELHYFNQREEWTPFIWPGDALENNTHVEWQTETAGPRVAFDYSGRFGLIRLLERAAVTQQDNARYRLQWTAESSDQALPLQVQLRSEAGAGPLDVLMLRHFVLPTRIFVTSNDSRTERRQVSLHPMPRSDAAVSGDVSPNKTAPTISAARGNATPEVAVEMPAAQPEKLKALTKPPHVGTVLQTMMETLPPASDPVPASAPVATQATVQTGTASNVAPLNPATPVAPTQTDNPSASAPDVLALQRQWYVHVASYNNQANAKTTVDALIRLAYPAESIAVPIKSGTQFRVRAGPFSTRASVLKAQGKIVRQGYRQAWSTSILVQQPSTNANAPVSE